MKRLYAPWRHKYVTKQDQEPEKLLLNDCVFCENFSQIDDKAGLILKRLEHSVIVMNKYPYNAGHLMVLPYDHKPTLKDLSPAMRSEIIEAVSTCTQMLEDVLKCQGINMGINQGEASGGGIPSHLHIHILPRWQGDTNFLATTAHTNIICSDLLDAYDDLKKWLDTNIPS